MTDRTTTMMNIKHNYVATRTNVEWMAVSPTTYDWQIYVWQQATASSQLGLIFFFDGISEDAVMCFLLSGPAIYFLGPAIRFLLAGPPVCFFITRCSARFISPSANVCKL